ncbi:putative bifunctional diguanylate cyclase/phosphodiesterase [Kiloniella sp. b19]|uniref:putative bifunctional diguanylate cyclase/phosphodiesterase n=1 Tax=Kiloniella sp. GXU_MW_B19 TaxID=3141326 RepID=UPI0031E42635
MQQFDREKALKKMTLLDNALRHAGDVVYCWDLATDALEWFGADALFKQSEEAVPANGEGLNALISPEDLPNRMRMISEHLSSGEPYECEYRVRDQNGGFHWVHDRGSVVFSNTGVAESFYGVMRPVTLRKQAEARLEFLANYDELSGHFNKVRLREATDFALQQTLRYDSQGAFLAVGIDHLGMINTAYGFEVGDAILVAVGERLDGVIRSSDIIGRLGGDRFGIVMSMVSFDEALSIAERILQVVREAPFEVNGERIYITVSAGMVRLPHQTRTSHDAFAKAESALLFAKSNGRDCCKVYTLSDEQREHYRVSMEVGEEVKQALNEGRIKLAYQPVVRSVDGEPVLVEALLRMIDEKGDIVPAQRFIPVVEQLGMIRVLDRRVLELALNDLVANPDITIAINISGLTASDRSWLRVLFSRVKGRADIAKRLVVEITETAALHDLEESARFVAAVRDLGCRVAIDDFGAGYTTFRHLKALTVDVVKIDGSFIRGIVENTENQIFVRNLISLAKALNLQIIAEFVETREEADFLCNEGVDLLQGYYFGKPEIDPEWKLLSETLEDVAQ